LKDIISYKESNDRNSTRDTLFSFKIIELPDNVMVVCTINEFEQYIAYIQKENLIYSEDTYPRINTATQIILNFIGKRSGNQVTLLNILLYFMDPDNWDEFVKYISQYIELTTVSKIIIKGFGYLIKNDKIRGQPDFVQKIISTIGLAQSLSEICSNEITRQSRLWKSFVKGALQDSDPQICTSQFELVHSLFRTHMMEYPEVHYLA